MSIFPKVQIRNGIKLQFALCCECSVVRALEKQENHAFPDSGFWIECPVCKTYRMFYRISKARVVNTASDEFTDAVRGTQENLPPPTLIYTRWDRVKVRSRPDFVGFRRVQGGVEYLTHNEAMWFPYYLTFRPYTCDFRPEDDPRKGL